MTLYDIIQLEDNQDTREIMNMYAEEKGLSYLGVESLKELEDMLHSSSSAKVYVVDSYFPFLKGGEKEPLAIEAINRIRHYHPDARIVLYASPGLKEIARENEVDYENKAEVTCGEIVRSIKFLLEK